MSTTKTMMAALAAGAMAWGALAADFENRWVTLDFDGTGRLASLREKASGRELVAEKAPFVEVTLASGMKVFPETLKVEDGRLRFGFGARGELTLAVKPFDGGWTLTTETFTVADAEELVFAQVTPVCNAHKGGMSNIVMDDASAVVVRGYTPDVDMIRADPSAHGEYEPADRTTQAFVQKRFGFVGKSAGLSAGPKAKILDMLKAMTIVAGVPRTGCGGAWSAGAEANRSSYLFAAFMDYASLDDWIRLMDKAGCPMLHFHLWWTTRGSYDVAPSCFPGGLKQMAEAVERVHAAGKLASTHTLSATVEFGDRYVSSEWFDDYVTSANYTLARPYREGEMELYVNEKPWERHSRTVSGGNNGNVLRIGNDLLQYTDFSTEKPYRFMGVHVAREPWGDFEVWDPTQAVTTEFDENAKGKNPARRMTRKEYPAGFAVDYLHHRYGEFYAKPGSRLAERLTDELADKFNTCRFDGIYFDGAEGQPGRYERDWLTKRTFEKLRARNGSIINSRSCRDPYNWWFRSLQGTWDHPTYGPRSFHDRHIGVYRDGTAADFMAIDLGWWNTRGPSRTGRGYFPEEMEYFGCKSAANDATVSVNGARISDGPVGYSMDEQLTIFGWWSRARYARAFKPGLQARMVPPGEEWRLRQDARGEWRVRPFKTFIHRVGTPDAAAWTVDAAADAPAELRVEALYAADREAAKTNTVRILDAGMFPTLEKATADGVTLTAETGSDAAHGATIRLTAKNGGAPAAGAWARLSRVMPDRQTFDANEVSTLWVKGDGSGATLNVQLRRARERGRAYSENLVKLDFTGWRRFDLLLRERDADASSALDWPYDDKRKLNTHWWNVFSSAMRGNHNDAASLWLNDIPQGKSVTVEVGAWDSIPMARGCLEAGSEVTVDGKAFKLPFVLPGGDYAELKDGAWIHYAETGEPLERAAAAEAPALRVGANALAFRGNGRAEVTLFALGADETAFGPLTADQRQKLAIEYETPGMLSPAKGLSEPFAVRVRPGEKAKLGFEIYGPVTNPVVWGRKMSVTLRDAFDKIVCTDGKTWEAVRITPGELGYEARISAPKRERIAGGTFAEPLPVLGEGTTRVLVTAAKAEGTRVTFCKRYEP